MTTSAETGKALRYLRRARDITQKQLAESIGIHVDTISSLERGGSITVDRKHAILEALDCDRDDFDRALRETSR